MVAEAGEDPRVVVVDQKAEEAEEEAEEPRCCGRSSLRECVGVRLIG
jgi:hypothetical protein